MGIVTTRTVTCDWKNCRNNAGQNGPVVVSFCVEQVENNPEGLPDEAKKFVSLMLNNQAMTFCKPLHAAQFFLPVGYKIVEEKVVEFPKMENPVNGQEGA